MSNEMVFLAIILAIIVWALSAEWVTRSLITMPIIFTAVGYSLTVPIGMIENQHLIAEVARLVAEITLIIVLFADASHVRVRELAANYVLPLRMLLIGMPLTMLFGMVVVYLVTPSGSWAVALLTAAVLTPTDAALGASVVSSKTLPRRLTQTINVESGLNDGLALPFVLIGAIAASMAAAGAHDGDIFRSAIKQVILGPVAGGLIGFSIAWMMNKSHERKWSNESSQAIVFLASAFAAYLLAELIGGNGFIAAFVAGAVFGNVYKYDVHFISEFMESQGQLATIGAFVIFGVFLLPTGMAHLSVVSLAVAVSFLTVVRMVPIFISLLGTSTTVKERLFLGWFGPRGLASILFGLIVLEDYTIPYKEEFMACVVVTVFLSIFLHGISATPLEKYFSRQSGIQGGD